MQQRGRIALAEAVGTCILVVGGPGTAVLATGTFFPKGSVNVIGVALAFGLSLLVACYAIGSISGCHINPAVTIGLWAIRKTQTRDLPFYIGGQIVGGLVGGLIIFIVADSISGFSAQASGFASNGYGSHSPSALARGGGVPGGFGLGAAILVEVVFTAIFVFIIASTTRKSMTAGFTGLTIGLTLTLIHLITIPVDNTSVNPVRSFSTAVFQGSWALEELWVFILFPIVGAVLGALIWRMLVPAEDV